MGVAGSVGDLRALWSFPGRQEALGASSAQDQAGRKDSAERMKMEKVGGKHRRRWWSKAKDRRQRLARWDPSEELSGGCTGVGPCMDHSPDRRAGEGLSIPVWELKWRHHLGRLFRRVSWSQTQVSLHF